MIEGLGAVVLAGGAATRLGGVDKPAVDVAGRSLLQRTVDAVPSGAPVVVVGPRRPLDRAVVWTREAPPGGGPVAALHAGMRVVEESVRWVCLLAADHPELTAETVPRLHAAISSDTSIDGAVLVDERGNLQWLLGLWAAEALRTALTGEGAGRSLRSVLGNLRFVEVPAVAGETFDVDTPEDLARARRAAES